MEHDKKSREIDLTRAVVIYARLATTLRSNPTELAALNDLWHAILYATGAYEIDWSEEFGRNRPATPRPPCRFCGQCESLGECSGCDEPICDDCADSHFEDHEVWMSRSATIARTGSSRTAPSDEPG